jgi:hypothetical protein
MAFQPTTSHALKSFAGAAVFGLTMDAAGLVSRHMSDAIWFALREVVGLLFWSVLSGWQSSHAQILGLSLFILGCPLQLVESLGALAHFLGSAV